MKGKSSSIISVGLLFLVIGFTIRGSDDSNVVFYLCRHRNAGKC